jgi:ketosteroid isomerase-like protein
MVEIMERHYAAMARGDVDGVLALYAVDTVWDDRELRPEGAIHRGRDSMAAQMGRWFATWDDYSWEVESIDEVGDQVLVVGRERGTGKTSGIGIDQRVGLVISFRGGLISQTKVYGDPDRAQAAVGLQRTGGHPSDD